MRKAIFILATLFLFCTNVSLAENIQILTVDEPPSSFLNEKGEPTGFSVDVVRELQKRLNNTSAIQIMPEARVIKTATESPDTLIFAFSRTPSREDKYHWIMHIIRKPWVFYSKKGANIHLKDLDDAKKVQRIGVVRGDVRENQLLDLGFKNTEAVTNFDQNIKKLQADRIPLLYHEPIGMAYTCKNLGIPVSEFEAVYSPKASDVYILMSKNGTSEETAKKWAEAAAKMKEDGTFQKIAEKWSQLIFEQVGIRPEYKDGALNF